MFLPVVQPLDLDLTLQSGQAFRWRSVHMKGMQGAWWHGFLGDEPVLLRQLEGGIELLAKRGRDPVAAKRLLDYLRLDDDIPAVYRRMTEHDPRLAKAVRRLHGMRLLRQDPWECLVTFLCSGHNNILRISLMVERMADAYGTKMALQGIGRCAFPSAQRLAGANEADLRRLGLGFRARGVAEAARMVASGGLPIQDMKAWPYGRAKERLLTVRGIGEKIADCVLLFSLDKLEAFPIDRWVRRAAEDWYAPPVRLGPRGKPLKEAPYADLLAWAQQKWEGDAGYANQYLFLGRRAEEREVGQMRRAR